MSRLNSEIYAIRYELGDANPTASIKVRNWYDSRYEDTLIITVSGIKPEEFRLPKSGDFVIGIKRNSSTGKEEYSLWTKKQKAFVGAIRFTDK